eukprot:Lankesteria_metandrocarpae@DN3758_c0_g1_i1.p1
MMGEENVGVDREALSEVFRANLDGELLLNSVPSTVLLSELGVDVLGNYAAVKKRVSYGLYDIRKSSIILDKAMKSNTVNPPSSRRQGAQSFVAASSSSPAASSSSRKRSRMDISTNSASAPSSGQYSGGRPTREELLRRLRQKIDDLKTGKQTGGAQQRLSSPEEVDQKKGNKRRISTGPRAKPAPGGSAPSTAATTTEQEQELHSTTATKSITAEAQDNDDTFEYSRFGVHDAKGKVRQKLIEDTTAPITNKGAKAKRIRDGIKALEKRNASLAVVPDTENRDGEMKSVLMDDAIKKAEGLRVLDNLKKLRARQKTMFKRKAASKQKWADRVKQQEEQQKVKQQRRQDAIRERRDKKRLQLAKKGKVNFFDMVTSGAESWQQQQEMEKVLN